jgi:hypothetical protein
MGRELGRISGPLLADNLLRNGSNLAFDNQVLYLDVVNGRIGANNPAPQTELYTPTAIRSTNLIATGSTTAANFSISASTIQNSTNSITFSQPITTPGLSTANLYASANTVTNTVTNSNVNISPNGSGLINFSNGASNVSVTVGGSLHATGNITFDGNVVLGNDPTDTITFLARINSNLVPDPTNTYTLGNSSLKWATIYTNSVSVGTVNIPTTSATTLNAGNFSIAGTTITSNSSNVNFNITASGTGSVKINGTKLFASLLGNQLPNTSSSAYNLVSTGNGYFKFAGTSGVTIPIGTSAQRPGNAITGMMRYNTDLQYGEAYNGNAWIGIGGVSSSLTLEQVNNIMLTNVIIFGR